MNFSYRRVYVLTAIFFLTSACNNDEKLSGEKIAENYCSSCHSFPEPSLLDKNTWEKYVLPKMGERLGIAYYNGQYFTNIPGLPGTAKNSNEQLTISFDNWDKLIHFYFSTAPLKLPPQARPNISEFTNRFAVKEGTIEGSYPSTTYVKIDPGNNLIYTANAYDSLFTVFDTGLHLLHKQNIQKVAVDMCFDNNLDLPGERNGVLTNMGILYPNDIKTGSLETFHLSRNGVLDLQATISDSIPRPVQTVVADLDNDSQRDYLVCGFGNNTGAFYYMHKDKSEQYKEQILRPLPGAIKAYVDDYNDDGLPDIIALFAQAQEGILLFLNKGNGDFETKEILSFPPVYGSTYFEMADMNGDGLKDIIYTCGDNLDFTSSILKNYHGVYIFLNKGNYQFEQRYFFPIHGCYKAMARDFDEDGDFDIAAISYFPDAQSQPEEAFVYLDNKGVFNFSPSSIKQFNHGNWATMDAGDVDGDGDDDIVIGSLLLTIAKQIPIATTDKIKPAFLLFINQTK